MSKGSRTRADNAEKNRLKKEKEAFEATKKKVRRVTAIITGSLLALMILITLIGTIVYQIRMNGGEYLRTEIAASSGDLDVNGSMMNYYFNDVYNTFVDYYGSYVSYYGLDPTLSLKQQQISEGQTWFSYFMSGAQETVSSILLLNRMAEADGISLTEAEIAAITNRAKGMDTGLYGRGVNTKDITDAKLLEGLAYKYQFARQAGLQPTLAEMEEHYKANTDAYLLVDYICYDMTYSDKGPTREEISAIADTLAKAPTPDAFRKAIEDKLRADDPVISREDIDYILDSVTFEGAYFAEEDEFSEWAFKEAKVGDTKIIEDPDKSVFYVYMITKAPYRDEASTVNVRHILLTQASAGSDSKAKKLAEKLLAEFEAGDKSEEAFGLLALEYSDDTGSYYNGGLYENVGEGDMVTAFNDWCFDPSRKEGDTGIVETDYGYHVMLFCGEGQKVWESLASYALINEKMAELMEENSPLYPVTFDDTVLKMIPG